MIKTAADYSLIEIPSERIEYSSTDVKSRFGVQHVSCDISAIVLTKDSEAYIEAVVEALAFCDEIIILDTGSKDQTTKVVSKFYNVRLYILDGKFPGFGYLRQYAIALAKHDWILSIDSDEFVSKELAAEISELKLDLKTVYSFPFNNYFNGRHIKTCGWYPDRHERLFNRKITNFTTSQIHEKVATRGLHVVRLKSHVDYYSYASMQDFHRKMLNYSQLFAKQYRGIKKASTLTAVTRSLWMFFKSYILQKGFIQGVEGFVISNYKAQTVFWKYMFLREANKKL